MRLFQSYWIAGKLTLQCRKLLLLFFTSVIIVQLNKMVRLLLTQFMLQLTKIIFSGYKVNNRVNKFTSCWHYISSFSGPLLGLAGVWPMPRLKYFLKDIRITVFIIVFFNIYGVFWSMYCHVMKIIHSDEQLEYKYLI